MCKTVEAVLVAEKINIQIKDVLEVLEQIENNEKSIYITIINDCFCARMRTENIGCF